MCRILGLSRQSYYYQSKPKKDESELEEVVAEEFIQPKGLRLKKNKKPYQNEAFRSADEKLVES